MKNSIQFQHYLLPVFKNKALRSTDRLVHSLIYGLIFLIYVFFSFQSCYASFYSQGIGARPIALGGAYVGLADNSDAIFTNPAGIANIQNLDVSVFYAMPYGIKELAYSALGLVCPTRRFSFGVAAQTYGHRLYRETTVIAAFGSSHLNKIYYGLNIRYMTLQIERYGSAGCFSYDAGILFKPLTNFSVGAFAGNISRSVIGREKEKLPQVYSTGIYFQPFYQLGLALDIYKDVSFPVEFHYGIEYKLVKYIDLRIGNSNNPARFSAGLGFYLNSMRFDYAVYTHRDLGLTHQFSISFSKGKTRTFKKDVLPSLSGQRVKIVKKKSHKKIKKLKPGSGETININTADLKTLQRIPHIGKAKARAIIDYRNQNGPFIDLIELEKVKGIGLKNYEKIKNFISLQD